MLHDGLADPVNAGIVADNHMLGIDKDDLIVFVSGILVHPVGVQHSEVSTSSASTLLSDTAKVSLELQLVDTLVLGLTVHNTLSNRALSTTSANGNTVDNKTLLGLVTKLVRLVGSGGSSDSDNLLGLSIFPGSANKSV